MPGVSDRPLLAVSMGDPAGIGPEVIAKALSVQDVRDLADTVVYGDAHILDLAIRMTHLGLRVAPIKAPNEARGLGPDVIPLIAVSSLDASSFAWGKATPETDQAQLDYFESAAKAVLAGDAQAVVTAPISKTSIHRAGSRFVGHTEMLAALAEEAGHDAKAPVMMIAGDHLKVVPLTVHMALREVVLNLSDALVLHTVSVVHEAFGRYFDLAKARIAVAGLNPHAGEDGMFGDEEARHIVPALEEARRQGISVFGPFPPDTVFRRAVDGEFDVVIGMYHDQALIPVKLLDFDRAVNVTLGLPLIRTSVDHGTAYDLAGQGVASAGSMIAALRLAARMAKAEEARVA